MPRLALLCLFAAALLFGADAKIVTVSGQVVQLGPGTYPPNTFDYAPDDTPSPTLNGALAIGVFDEQLGVVVSSTVGPLSNGGFLQPGIPYDSFYAFFHQKQPSTTRQTAAGTVTTDNRVVGCTASGGQDDRGALEIATDSDFGLPGIQYQSSQENARGFENADFALAAGTTFVFTSGIGQPGDYTRCFTETCSQCSCTVGVTFPAQCLTSMSGSQTVQISDLSSTFTDTCAAVTSDSLSLAFDPSSCTGGSCQLNPDGSITVSTASPVTVNVLATAGCGCAQSIPVTFQACSCSNCPSSKTCTVGQSSCSEHSTTTCATLVWAA